MGRSGTGVWRVDSGVGRPGTGRSRAGVRRGEARRREVPGGSPAWRGPEAPAVGVSVAGRPGPPGGQSTVSPGQGRGSRSLRDGVRGEPLDNGVRWSFAGRERGGGRSHAFPPLPVSNSAPNPGCPHGLPRGSVTRGCRGAGPGYGPESFPGLVSLRKWGVR